VPLYDYECENCGREFEVLVPISQRDDVSCKCGARARRQITGGSFLLLGGGWSGHSHARVVPPQSDPSLTHGWKDNYYNCTPESVHKT
jgi:putative FmdB family regulatory protein